MLGRICVYCASSPGRNEAITAATVALGKAFVARGTELVYGGGSVGLMGLLADTVLEGGGRVTGVIPTRLFSSDFRKRWISGLAIWVDRVDRQSVSNEKHFHGRLILSNREFCAGMDHQREAMG